MNIHRLSPSEIGDFLHVHRNRYTIINVRMKDCAPCTRLYPKYEKLCKKYQPFHMDPLVFAEYMISDRESYDALPVKYTPAYHMYYMESKVFDEHGVKGMQKLEEYLHNLTTYIAAYPSLQEYEEI